MKITISREVPYLQYVQYAIDNDGEVCYDKEIYEFEQELDENRDGFWRVEVDGMFVDSIVETVPFEEVKGYAEYLDGWLETHEDHDYITFEEWTRSDEYELSK